MPMQRKLYPKDWEALAKAFKTLRGWICEECGKQCRRPGEPHVSQKNTLTVAHLDHNPGNNNPRNWKALCAPCHCRYDAPRKAQDRRAKKYQDQLSLWIH